MPDPTYLAYFGELTNLGISRKYANVAMWRSPDDFSGALAMWAIRQSPYPVPDNLEIAVKKVNEKVVLLADEQEGSEIYLKVTLQKVQEIVSDFVHGIPEIMAWNYSVNDSNSEYTFTSRTFSPQPDDDFIDLDALARNVSYSIFRSGLLDMDREDIEKYLESENYEAGELPDFKID